MIHKKLADIPSLSGLRFFAALSIVVGHFGGSKLFYIGSVPMSFGNITILGMPLFFVLSGFVIHYNYARYFREKKYLSAVSEFATARFARLMPLLAFVLFVSLAAANFAPEYPKLLIINALGMYSWIPVWDNGNLHIQNPMIGTGLTWSISTEIFFYVMYALVGYKLMHIKKQRTVLALATFVSIGVIAMFYYGYIYTDAIEKIALDNLTNAVSQQQNGAHSFIRWLFYISPYARIFEFIMGALVAHLILLQQHQPLAKHEKAIGSIATYAASLLIMASFVWMAVAFDPNSDAWGDDSFVRSLHRNFFFAVPFSLIIYCLARYPHTYLNKYLGMKHMVSLGAISYSMYLLHPFAQRILPIANTGVGLYLGAASAILMVVILSLGSYTMIEKPSRVWIRNKCAHLHDQKLTASLLLAGYTTPFAAGFVFYYFFF